MNLPEKYICKCGRCECSFGVYTPAKYYYPSRNNRSRKAGGFISDRNGEFIVLVQSCGKLWGPPKGSVEEGETIRAAAIREIREETGLDVSDIIPDKFVRFKSRYFYFNIQVDSIPRPSVQKITGNDANAVGVFNVQCIVNNTKADRFSSNQHLKYIFQHFLKIML